MLNAIVLAFLLTVPSESPGVIFADSFEKGWACNAAAVRYIAVQEDTELSRRDMAPRTFVVVPNAAFIRLPPAGSIAGWRITFDLWVNATIWPSPPGCGFVAAADGKGHDGLLLGPSVVSFVAVPAFLTVPSRWLQTSGPALVSDPNAPPCRNVPVP